MTSQDHKQVEEQPMDAPADVEPKQETRKSRWGVKLPPELIETKRRNDDTGDPQLGGSKVPVHEDDLSQKRFRGFRRGRSSSTCRFNQPTFETKHLADWRCLVCYLWNQNERYRCQRCGAQEGVDRAAESNHARQGGNPRKGDYDRAHQRHYPHGGRRNDPPDNRGRSGAIQERKSVPRVQEWPPVFDTNGSEYIFDHRSQMFYEAQSDFFYDPKSKLYYGNKKRAYFGYDALKTPPFVQVGQTSPPTEQTPKSEKDPKPSTSPRPSRKEIVIKIKSTARSLSRPRDKSEKRRAGSHNQNEQLKNVVKWTKKQEKEVQLSLKSVIKQSIQAEAALPSSDSESQNIHIFEVSLEEAKSTTVSASHRLQKQAQSLAPAGTPQSEEAPSISQDVAKAATGEPICTLCMRKFSDLEKLRQHVQLSKLHEANVKKRKAETPSGQQVQPASSIESKTRPSSETKPAVKYTDRAAKRRMLHHDLPTRLSHNQIPDLFPQQKIQRTAMVDPASILGAHNIGNQLFQKMVSKGSTTITKNPETRDEDRKQEAAEDFTTNLRKDWERMESFSRQNGAARRPGPNLTEKPGLGSKSPPWEDDN